MPSAVEIAADLCRKFEGLYLTAYTCPAGVWTVGFGATGSEIGPGVVWTRAQAEERLYDDLRRFQGAVLRLCPVLATDERRQAAILDFVFNLGPGRLQAATLRRAVLAQDWDWAKAELRKWNRAGGRVLRGLVLRREAEASLL